MIKVESLPLQLVPFFLYNRKSPKQITEQVNIYIVHYNMNSA